jgi:hypothetical protein
MERFFCEIKYRRKVIAKARATSKKESRRKASQRTYFALQEKWTKIISYSSKLHRFRS